MACRCMRGTVSPCHVALSKTPATHSGASVRAILTTFNRRSRSNMAQAVTICSQGRGERGYAWPGTFPRVLPLHALYEHVPVPFLVARSLPCSCPAMQTRRSTQTQSLDARVPCTCLRGPLVRACSAPACVCFTCPCPCAVLHLVNMLHCGEFYTPIDSLKFSRVGLAQILNRAERALEKDGRKHDYITEVWHLRHLWKK